MPSAILGISAYYHDSAAVLLVDGKIVAAAHEERFSRIKHDSGFPRNAAAYVLREGGLNIADLEAVAFYDKPYLKFERLLETYNGFAPAGLRSFLSAIPVWIKEKLFMRGMLRDAIAELGPGKPKVLFPEHHLSHAASAFYPSPFDRAAILTIDGVCEWATTTICMGENAQIRILREQQFPHSLGLLYTAFTAYCGFKVNSGEYKLMGLAPYGDGDLELVARLKKAICDTLVDIREDGSLLLNMDYFDFATGLRMYKRAKWEKLLGIPPRDAESEIGQEYMALALAIQQVTEEIVLRLARTARELTGCDNLVMAGGVALNCVANGLLIRNGIFKNVWIQPASGDSGGALGAAYATWHIWAGNDRPSPNGVDAMQGAYLGPEFSRNDIMRVVRRFNAPHREYSNTDEL